MNGLVDGINRIAEAWWFSVMHAAWQSAVIGCVLLALVAWGRRWPSSVRYWLLVIALVKFAVPPLWSAPTGLFSYIAVTERHTATAPAAANAIANAKTDETSASALSPSEFRQRHESPTEIALQTPSSGGAHHDPIEFAANIGTERRSEQSAARTVTATVVSGPSSLSEFMLGSECGARRESCFRRMSPVRWRPVLFGRRLCCPNRPTAFRPGSLMPFSSMN
jgi:hypothetical protein